MVGFKTPEHALPLVSEVHIAHSYAPSFENILSIRFDEQEREMSNPWMLVQLTTFGSADLSGAARRANCSSGGHSKVRLVFS
jgi:hypothetical protein